MVLKLQHQLLLRGEDWWYGKRRCSLQFLAWRWRWYDNWQGAAMLKQDHCNWNKAEQGNCEKSAKLKPWLEKCWTILRRFGNWITSNWKHISFIAQILSHCQGYSRSLFSLWHCFNCITNMYLWCKYWAFKFELLKAVVLVVVELSFFLNSYLGLDLGP